jgi:hypothetical protein
MTKPTADSSKQVVTQRAAAIQSRTTQSLDAAARRFRGIA